MSSYRHKGLDNRTIEKDRQFVSPAGRIRFWPLVIREAKGSTIIGQDGRVFLDFLAGAAVFNIGHNHPRVVHAVKEQADKYLGYNSAYAYSELRADLAQALCHITPGTFPKQVAFGLSGSDANDGAIKAARSFTGRSKVISFLGSYHGTTYGALSVSGHNLNMRRRLGPFLPEIYHVPYADCYRCPFGLTYPRCGTQCLEHIAGLLKTVIPPDEVAAVVLEPIQGDAGVLVPPEMFVLGLKRLCAENGILLVLDEVQTGFGRTGRWFASEYWGLEPDIIVLGKAIASGMPLSAFVSRKEITQSWESVAHALSLSANPLSCVASLETMRVITEENLVERADVEGAYVKEKLSEMKARFELIGDIRGRGLMIGVDLVEDRQSKVRARSAAAKVCWRCWEKGLLLTFFSESVLRIAPPLTIARSEIDSALRIIEESFADVMAGKVPDDVLERIIGW